ncbi:MAG: hypothetical protein K0R92_1885 [Lachnospiraceae bacterium]|jgi:mRNA-degrading endonuclease HigB of HigAB toxin-antitoxin module|nr:hypothetical protein [Lachnospiraceae bacterium]
MVMNVLINLEFVVFSYPCHNSDLRKFVVSHGEYDFVYSPYYKLIRSDPSKDHNQKLSIKEYKEHQELKKELLRNNEKLKKKQLY